MLIFQCHFHGPPEANGPMMGPPEAYGAPKVHGPGVVVPPCPLSEALPVFTVPVSINLLPRHDITTSWSCIALSTSSVLKISPITNRILS